MNALHVAGLVSVIALAASCAASTPVSPEPATPRDVAAAEPAPTVAPPPTPTPPRPPPPVVRAAMAGEPESAALGEARLVTSSCDNYAEIARKVAEARVQQMRREVDEQLQSWRDAQPGCWEQYRWQARPHRYYSRGYGGAAKAYAPMADAAYGAVGSISLSGSGRGGGGGSVSAPPAPTPRKAERATGTNNQIAGVDEADIVKTDGRYVYLAVNGALRIVEALDPKLVSVTKLPGNVREMFIEGDRAVVYTASGGGSGQRCTYGYDCVFAGDGTATRIVVLDIKDRAAPRAVRTVDFSGSLMAARRIGSAVHTVIADADAPTAAYATWPPDLESCGSNEATVRAKFARLKVENERIIRRSTWFPTIREGSVERPMCAGLMRTAMGGGQAFTTVASFDLRDDNAPVVTATLQSRPGAVFASGGALYLSVVNQKARGGRWYSFYGAQNEVSEIHKFRIGASPRETRYVGSGVVPGHVLNQFAMDEWFGYLRIATTRGRVPDPHVESAVSVLAEAENGNLVRVGAVEKIAPGEDIRAVRFDGDRGYVVTFKKTDPLFVVDLYHPSRPAILGELKIPGFSTYMHRIDPGHLLSIGFDADDHGSFAYFDGVILQLFDVTKPTEPRLLHKEKIGTRGSSSEAATNHLAFTYAADRGLLAIPMTLCEGGGDGRNGDQLTFGGLLVYQVDLERGFKRLGGVNHGTAGASCSTWWSSATSAVKRSVLLDDLVYSIAPDLLKVQRLGKLGEDLASIALRP